MDLSNERIAGAFLWKIIEKIGTKGVQFVIQIVLARLLFPEDYGILAILTVFISLSNILIQSSFNTALIQKKETDNLDYSSVFYVSLGLAAVLYFILFCTAPFIAAFYHKEQLTSLLRVLALVLFPGALNSIQYAYVSRNLQFKKYSLACICSSILSGITGIGFAYIGFGVWALVLQQLIANTLSAFILLMLIKWKPQWIFSLQRVKILFSFGWKLLVSSLLNTGYIELFNLIIGKIYSSESLGLYNRGNQYPQLIVSNVSESVQSVMLPVLANKQEDKLVVKGMMRRGMLMSAFIIFPMMLGLMMVAEPVIQLTLTEKWLPAAPYLQLSCMLYLFNPIHTTNIQTWNALGRSDLFLKLEVVKKVIEITGLCITIPFGLKTMLFGQVILSAVGLFINIFPNRRLISYGFKEQLSDIFPTLIAAVGMAAVVFFVGKLQVSLLAGLIIQIMVGIVVYLLISIGLKNESLFYLSEMIREKMKNVSEKGN